MQSTRTVVCLAFMLLGWCGAARAQSQFAVMFDYYFTPEPLQKVVRDALDQPLGKAMLTGFAAAVTKAADPACLQSRKLDAAVLSERGRALFQRYGTTMLGTWAEMVDTKAYASALRAAGGSDAQAALDRLAGHPEVKWLKEIVQPARLAKIAIFLFENFDRRNLLTRSKFPPLSPFGDGNAALADQDPTDAALQAGKEFIESHHSPELRRFVALSAISQHAIRTSLRPDKVRASGPGEWFRGIDKDLAALCVIRPPG